MSDALDPNYKTWSYSKAREELWPGERHRAWIPWTKPTGADKRPIDGEIEKLITNTAKNMPRMRASSELMPLGHGTPSAYLQRAGELNPFCPYREVRAHWIPFALQVARIEAERHLRRNELAREHADDVAAAVAALRRLRRHDPDALAQVGRPLLAPLIRKEAKRCETSQDRDDGDLTPVPGCEDIRLGPIEEVDVSEVPELHGVIAQMMALRALKSAKTAIDDIEALSNFIVDSNLQFEPAASHQNEWQISFAATMGFAWRRLTGSTPPMTLGGSQFLNFVVAAYRSLSRAGHRDLAWERACYNAVRRHKNDFSMVDNDSTLMITADEVWRGIPLLPASDHAVTLLDDPTFKSVIDHILQSE